MTNASRVAGRHAVVTGASSGIGRATALALSAAGARISLVARRQDRLEAVASKIQSAGGEAAVIPADLARPGEAQRAAEAATRSFGVVGVLVNSAGGAVGGSVWGVGDAPQARAMFEIDFWSPLALIHAVLPAMRKDGGTVVNVTSVSQLATWPMFGYSAAVKAALAMITETLRLESARFDVDVIDVVPGPIDTPVQGPSKMIPGFTEAFHDTLGMATAEELAALIVEAIEERRHVVLCPTSVQSLYDDPRGARAQLAELAAAMFADGTALPDEMLDTLVIGGDDPIIVDAKSEWERAHAT